MSDYISREAALKELCANCAWTEKCNRYKNELPRCAQYIAISDIPAVDVEEDEK